MRTMTAVSVRAGQEVSPRRKSDGMVEGLMACSTAITPSAVTFSSAVKRTHDTGVTTSQSRPSAGHVGEADKPCAFCVRVCVQ